jgi:hypothetical protein
MKRLAIAAGVLFATVVTSASAQVYWSRPYSASTPYWASSNQECWNPRAGHFEGVRPGEYQGDLDFSRCRMIGAQPDRYYYERERYTSRGERREECWNPRAGHYEDVRRGETQDDLDFSRCRVYR